MRQPRIFQLPLSAVGTHETIVVVVDDIPQSINTWNFTEDAKGARTFYLEGITTWQLTIQPGSMVSVIR